MLKIYNNRVVRPNDGQVEEVSAKEHCISLALAFFVFICIFLVVEYFL